MPAWVDGMLYQLSRQAFSPSLPIETWVDAALAHTHPHPHHQLTMIWHLVQDVKPWQLEEYVEKRRWKDDASALDRERHSTSTVS